MENQEVLNKVVAIAKQVFNYDGEITENTTSADIKSWDSMNQVRFFAEVEGCFSIKFKIKDMLSFSSIGDIVRCVAKLMK